MNKGTFLSIYLHIYIYIYIKNLIHHILNFKKKSHQISPLGTDAANSTLVFIPYGFSKVLTPMYIINPKGGAKGNHVKTLRPSML